MSRFQKKTEPLFNNWPAENCKYCRFSTNYKNPRNVCLNAGHVGTMNKIQLIRDFVHVEICTFEEALGYERMWIEDSECWWLIRRAFSDETEEGYSTHTRRCASWNGRAVMANQQRYLDKWRRKGWRKDAFISFVCKGRCALEKQCSENGKDF